MSHEPSISSVWILGGELFLFLTLSPGEPRRDRPAREGVALLSLLSPLRISAGVARCWELRVERRTIPMLPSADSAARSVRAGSDLEQVSASNDTFHSSVRHDGKLINVLAGHRLQCFHRRHLRTHHMKPVPRAHYLPHSGITATLAVRLPVIH